MAKGVSLPVNAIIIMAIGLIVVLGLAMFATSSIFGTGTELSEQQALSDCCTRACKTINFDYSTGGEAITIVNAMNKIVCANQGGLNWEALKTYDKNGDGTVVLGEIISTKSSGSAEVNVNFAKSFCGC